MDAVAPVTSQFLQRSETDGKQVLTLSGAWVSANSQQIEAEIDALEQGAPPREQVVDAGALAGLDTLGALVLERILRSAEQRGIDAQLTGLPERYVKLFERVRRSSGTLMAPVEPRRPFILGTLETLGSWMPRFGDEAVSLLTTLGALFSALLGAIVRPKGFRLTSMVYQLDRVCWQATPLILLITFLIGCIIAQQGFFHFRRFGAEDYVVDLVGILVLREIGVLLVVIMVAGRSGSSYAAELGAMKMREEVDAVRTMGMDPVEVLMLPRVLALIIAVPILTFLGDVAAMVGGGVVAMLYAGMSLEIYIERLQQAISVTHFQIGMIKAPFMALIIGLVACTEGMKVSGSAESLGIQTTSSVVKSIFLVIVLDGAFAIFFASIGM